MAGQKPAARRSASTKQGPVRPGSPTARPGTASKRQTAAKPNSPADAKPKGSGAARPGTAKSATTAGTGNASGRSRTAAGGAAAVGTGANAAAVPVAQPAAGPGRGPLALFRSMGGLPLATLILSLYGLGASIYLTIAHYDAQVSLVCSDKGAINCEKVTTSPESIVFGIFPVAVLGLAFYVFMVAVNSPWGWRLNWPIVRWLRLGSVIVGMCFVLYLIYAELDLIHAICLWCTSVHVATFLIFALLVFYTAFSWEKPAASGGGRGL